HRGGDRERGGRPRAAHRHRRVLPALSLDGLEHRVEALMRKPTPARRAGARTGARSGRSKKLLVPFDGSKSAVRALRHAIDRVRDTDRPIHLLTVHTAPIFYPEIALDASYYEE